MLSFLTGLIFLIKENDMDEKDDLFIGTGNVFCTESDQIITDLNYRLDLCIAVSSLSQPFPLTPWAATSVPHESNKKRNSPDMGNQQSNVNELELLTDRLILMLYNRSQKVVDKSMVELLEKYVKYLICGCQRLDEYDRLSSAVNRITIRVQFHLQCRP